MTYSHKVLPMPQQYDQAATEKKWQRHWLENKTYAWDETVAREDSYVIDTPPPTVSGTLHMGHVFSYTQADFIARFQRMTGKNVFYPMGFDDNGLPTERLVEKTKKIRAVDMSREKFIEECLGVSEEARKEFRALFESIALSVDWAQEYHTISEDSRRLSQLSFLDLVEKGYAYRAQRPFYWDPVDQTAIASAEIEDKELPSFANEIVFKVAPSPEKRKEGRFSTSPLGEVDPAAPIAAYSNVRASGTEGSSGRTSPLGEVESLQHSACEASKNAERDSGEGDLIIMTTRPELLPACVALFCHPEDARYTHLIGKQAEVPLFGFTVPILADDTVEMEKGTGLMMCCTFGDDADIAKWQKHKLPMRVIINKFGKIDFLTSALRDANYKSTPKIEEIVVQLQGKKISNTDPKHPGARQIVIALLEEAGLLISKKPITHAVKCAERSGAPLEILPTSQWFVRVTDKKEALKKRAAECNWNPDWMRLRIEQWIDGLNQDWCISRQRYFGVPFPVWYAKDQSGKLHTIYAMPHQLPVNPLKDSPAGFKPVAPWNPMGMTDCVAIEDIYDANGNLIFKGDGHTWIEVYADPDVMDTWATSSISPQLSAGAVSSSVIPAQAGIQLNDGAAEKVDSNLRWNDAKRDRFSRLFPADLRPQAHEIIRTWAFYTIVKAHLHNDSVPWHNLMISGWCLAEDKSKMSKSKGNVITPVALIEERGTDAVRYWAGTSRLGADTAFSPDLLKIGKKLVGKLWNATQFAAIHLSKLNERPSKSSGDELITQTLDRWILSRLNETIAKATDAFTRYEYADALDATNHFFWADFCDNYLELIKKRIYNEDGSAAPEAQQSAVRTLYYVLDGILKLYAPFTPHVTEELYAHIFADEYAAKGSIHARGQWPDAHDYLLDAESLAAGRHALDVLEIIRKAKSESNRSIKYPIEKLLIFTATEAMHKSLTRVMADVAGAGNVLHFEFVKEKSAAMTHTPDEHAALHITFAKEADAAA